MADQLAPGMMTDLQGNVVPIPQGAQQTPISAQPADDMMTDLQGNRVPIPKGATQEPLPQDSALSRFGSGIVSGAKAMIPHDLKSAATSVMTGLVPGGPIIQGVQAAEGAYDEYKQARKEGQPIVSAAAGSVGSLIGLDPEGIRERAAKGDVAGIAGESVPSIALTLLGPEAHERVGRAFQSDARALQTASSAHDAAVAMYDQRLNEHGIATDQAIQATKDAKQAAVDFQDGKITKQQLDDTNTRASEATANARKATQALSDVHDQRAEAAAEVDKLNRKIQKSKGTVTAKQTQKAAEAREDFKKAVPPAPKGPAAYTDRDLDIADAYLENHHKSIEPIESKQGVASALDYIQKNMEQQVAPYRERYANEPITRNVRMDVREALADNPRADFVEKGMKALEPYNLIDPSVEEADRIRKQLNAEVRGRLQDTKWNLATALEVDPEFAAKYHALDSLRNGEYDLFEDKGISGIRELRQDEASIIRVRNAAERNPNNGDVRVRGSNQPGAIRKAAQWAVNKAGIGVGAKMAGPAGAVVGDIATNRTSMLGKAIYPDDLTRDQLIQRRMKNSVAGIPITEITGAGQPSGPFNPPGAVSPRMQMYVPQREMSPLHTELATFYNENVHSTPYVELEDRFMQDVADKRRHGVPLESDEKSLLGKINQADAADMLAAQKQMQELAAQGKTAPHPTLPDEVEPLLQVPKSKFADGMNTQQGIVHDLAHAVVGTERGIEFPDGIRSHLHPEVSSAGALMSAPINFEPFMDADGNIDPVKLKSKMADIAATYVAGGVANDLYHDIPFTENHHLGADVRILKQTMRSVGFTEAEASKMIAQATEDAAQILGQPGVQDVLERHSAVREAGLDEKYHVSPERVEQILQDVKDQNETTGKSPATSGAGKRANKEAGAGTEAGGKEGNTTEFRQEKQGPVEGKGGGVRENEPASRAEATDLKNPKFAAKKIDAQGRARKIAEEVKDPNFSREFSYQSFPIGKSSAVGRGNKNFLLADGSLIHAASGQEHDAMIDDIGAKKLHDAGAIRMTSNGVEIFQKPSEEQLQEIGRFAKQNWNNHIFWDFAQRDNRNFYGNHLGEGEGSIGDFRRAIDTQYGITSENELASGLRQEFVGSGVRPGEESRPAADTPAWQEGQRTGQATIAREILRDPNASPEERTWANRVLETPENPKLNESDEDKLTMGEQQTPLKRNFKIEVIDNEGNSHTETIPGFSSKDAIRTAQKKFPGASTWGIERVDWQVPGSRAKSYEGETIPTTEGYSIPKNKRISMRPGGRDNNQVEFHELGHAMVGLNDGMAADGMLRHTHPDMPRNATAAVRWDINNLKDPQTNRIAADKMPVIIRSLMGGTAADEVFNNVPRAENHNFKITANGSDANTAYRFLRDAGYGHDDIMNIMNRAVDQAKEHLTRPEVSDIIKENHGLREPGLSRQYHYSPDRLQSMHDEAMRRAQNGAGQANNPGVGGEGGTGRAADVPGGEGGTAQAPGSTVQAAELTPQQTIENQGLVYKGEVVPGSGVHQFEHPNEPGKTAALREPFIGSQVRDKMQSKLAENPIVPQSPKLSSDRVSTRVPEGKNATENPLQGEPLGIDRKAVEASPQKLQDRFANNVRQIPGVKIPKNISDNGKVFDRFVGHVADNLKFLYDQATPEEQENNAKWYESAHKLTKDLADQHGLTHSQTAGVTAAMSPQMDWDQNVSLAKRIVDIYKNHADEPVTPEMIQKGQDIIEQSRKGKDKKANSNLEALLPDIEGKKIGELTGWDRAAAVRLFDEVNNPRQFPRIDPATGNEMEVLTNTDGTPANVAWGNLNNIGKALSILDDGSRENISNQVGSSHKVRNFYNNIIDPTNDQDVTIDTHAVAAGLLQPLGGNARVVTDNFGGAGKSAATGVKGTYPLYAEAYRQAAKDLGLKPRELQSVVWEKVRNIFPAEWKTKDNLNAVNAEWKKYQDGKQTADKTRQNIINMPIDKPTKIAQNRAKAGIAALGGE
jgi:hypothetical protein